MLSLPALHGPPLPLPSLTHQPPHPSTTNHPAFTTTNPSHAHNHHPHHPAQNNPNTPRAPPSPTLLRLSTDESLLSRRRTHIARFGSHWLRPPGVPKTLAGMEDEILERAEAEQMRAREADVMAFVAGAEAEGEAEEEEEEEGEGMDADLDAGVPEADEEEGEGWSEDEEEEEEVGGFEGDEGGEEGEGGIEGLGMFEGEGDYATPPPQPPARRGAQQRFDNATAAIPLPEWATGMGVTPRTPVAAGMGTPMTGMAMSGGGDLDLDAGVPEAGDYEHTDTEVEDVSTDDDDGWAAAGSSRVQAAAGVGRSTGGGPGDSLGAAQYRVRDGGVIAPTPRGEIPGYVQGQRRSEHAPSHPRRDSAGRERSTRRSERRRNAYQTPSFDAGPGSSSFDGGSGMGIGEDSLLGGSVFGSSPLTVSMGGFDGMGGGVGDGRASVRLASGVSGSGGRGGGGTGRDVSGEGGGRQSGGGSGHTARNEDLGQAEAAAAYRRRRDRRRET